MPGSIEIKEKLVKLVPHLVLESYRWDAHYTFLGKTPSFILRQFFCGKPSGLRRPRSVAGGQSAAKTGRPCPGYTNGLIFNTFLSFLKLTGAKQWR